jgi:CheY-like chemotaxis protein
MAQISHKITDFPTRPDRHPSKGAGPEHLEDDVRDPARDSRSPIEELEAAVREARRSQRLAEDECDRLRRRLSEYKDGADDVDVKALLRERDMLREQQSQYGPVIAELKVKLKAAESECRAAFLEREEDTTALRKAHREKDDALAAADDARRKQDEAVRQRDAIARQRDLVREEKEEALHKLSAAERRFSDAQKALTDLRKEIGSAKKGDGELAHQLATLRQARDGMSAQIKELQRKVEELEDQAAELSYARDAAQKESAANADKLHAALESAAANDHAPARIAELEAQLDGLRQENASLAQNVASLTEDGQRTTVVLRQLHGQLDATARDKEQAEFALHEARTSLLSAQKQIDAIIRDRETMKQQLSENMIGLDAQLKEQAAEIGRLQEELSDARSKLSERDGLREQFDKRRLDMIELTAQLENAHREIRTLSATLAEVRLQAKLAGTKIPAPPKGPAACPKAGGSTAEAAAAAGNGEDSRDDADDKNTILGLRRCFQNFSREPEHLELLDEMKTRVQLLADAGRDHGHPIMHRVSVAFVTLLNDMREIPDQISQGTLRTVNQTIELIASLVDNPDIEQSVVLHNARAYVVDDDPATCATVVDALNIVGLKTDYALYSSAAVAELAGNHYDLIILDVHLPDLDGFELCAHIRNMALHAETPVFFMSGNTSLENRVKSSLRGGNEFIPKPFSIQELALKSLKSVISAQLQNR